MQVMERDEWLPRAEAHAARVDRWIAPHLARRQRGEKHPVHDFLFDYYSQRPAALRRWHPGAGVVLLDAPEYADLKGYAVHRWSSGERRRATSRPDHAMTLTEQHLGAAQPLIGQIHTLLVATAARPAMTGCFGLHEWAMVHRSDQPRHDVPLRLGADGTDRVVESHRIACTHFDAFRFFTPSARPLNTLSPGRDDRAVFEQPGCLHAGMDLYKHAFRLSPLVPSELVADCFALASDIREVDMRASPYDLGEWGFEPVRIETAAGKHEYAAAQRGFAERGAPLRQRLIEACDELRATATGRSPQDVAEPAR